MKREETLPENWLEQPLMKLISPLKREKPKQIKSTEFKPVGKYPVVDQSNKFIAGFTNKEIAVEDVPVIIFGDHTCEVKYIDFPFVVGADGTQLIYPNRELDIEFFYYQLCRLKPPQNGYQRHFKYVKEINFPYPDDRKQQQKIAAILSSLDDAIEKTQAVIDQLNIIKRGLMQELFTRGVPGWHTEYKKTQSLGCLPNGWSIKSLGDLTSIVTSGSRGWAKYYSEEGALFIRIGNLTRRTVDIDLSDIQKLQLPSNVEGQRSKLQPDDLLISITADLGITNIVPKRIDEAYINQHIALVRISAPEAIPRFVAYWLSYGLGQKQFMRLNDVGAKSGLNLSSIRAVKVALPSLKEQQKLIDVLDDVAVRISYEQAKKAQLETIKKGLMQGLLSGRMAVNTGG